MCKRMPNLDKFQPRAPMKDAATQASQDEGVTSTLLTPSLQLDSGCESVTTEDLSMMYKKRVAAKGWLSRTMNKAQELLDSDQPDQEALKVIQKELETRLNNLDGLQSDLELMIESESEMLDDIEKAGVFLTMQAIEVPVICAPLSRPSLPASVMAELSHLPMAGRPPPDEPLHVHILVGMDYFWSMAKFRESIRMDDGRYEVALPWKRDPGSYASSGVIRILVFLRAGSSVPLMVCMPRNERGSAARARNTAAQRRRRQRMSEARPEVERIRDAERHRQRCAAMRNEVHAHCGDQPLIQLSLPQLVTGVQLHIVIGRVYKLGLNPVARAGDADSVLSGRQPVAKLDTGARDTPPPVMPATSPLSANPPVRLRRCRMESADTGEGQRPWLSAPPVRGRNDLAAVHNAADAEGDSQAPAVWKEQIKDKMKEEIKEEFVEDIETERKEEVYSPEAELPFLPWTPDEDPLSVSALQSLVKEENLRCRLPSPSEDFIGFTEVDRDKTSKPIRKGSSLLVYYGYDSVRELAVHSETCGTSLNSPPAGPSSSGGESAKTDFLGP
ncbi:hypothetical protein FJT64_000950 [Amphibalanus amphitrite]|uniref:Uncharacterized protein n=1 Tax=Amphibalanus amphitrite TaxID=1232801 RepID=A0A6A4VGU1_AMPAM|nr:hypothetical protein FJT64_000950 [Amphibalanus amphitrite]